MKFREIIKLTWPATVIASLCCLSPIILVLLGLSTVTLASTLADTLYGDYKWHFRAFGLFLLLVSAFFYIRRTKGICTLDQVKKRRQEIINILAISLVAGTLAYVIFLYVIVHYIGVFLDLWP